MDQVCGPMDVATRMCLNVVMRAQKSEKFEKKQKTDNRVSKKA